MQNGNGSMPSRSDRPGRLSGLTLLWTSLLVVLLSPSFVGAQVQKNIFHNANILADHDFEPTRKNTLETLGSTIKSIEQHSKVGSKLHNTFDHLRNKKTGIYDLKGKTILPGFHNGDVRLIFAALKDQWVNLNGSLEQIATKLKEAQSKTTARVLDNKGQAWIIGYAVQTEPTLDDLNDHPIWLWHYTFEKAYINKKAKKLLDVDSNFLVDRNALDHFRKRFKPTIDEVAGGIERTQAELLRAGIVSIQTKLLFEDVEVLALKKLFDEKKLKIRVGVWGPLERLSAFQELAASRLPNDWIRLLGLFTDVDGLFAIDAANTLESPKQPLQAFHSQEALDALVLQANKAGFPVRLAASGSKGVTMAMTAIDRSKQKLFNSRIHNSIDRATHCPPQIFDRLALTRTQVMIYPTSSDNVLATTITGHIKQVTPYATMDKSNVLMSVAQEWPSETLDTWRAFQLLSQEIGAKAALNAFTINPARALQEDHLWGTLRDGKLADFIVVNKDPISLNPKTTQVEMTVVDGQIVYSATPNNQTN